MKNSNRPYKKQIIIIIINTIVKRKKKCNARYLKIIVKPIF